MKDKDSHSRARGPHGAAAEGAGGGGGARWAERLSLAGLAVYAAAAPHSIAGAWIGLSFAVLGWLARALAGGRLGLRRTPLDLPLWLLFAWTVLSALLSAEPRTSLAKLVSAGTFLVFYLAQALLTRRRCVALAAILVASGVAGVLWGAGDLMFGRGVVVRGLRADSPLRATPLREGDAVWRVRGRRVASVEELDEAIRATPDGARLSLSVISRGEHVEWDGPAATPLIRGAASPSGVTGGGRTHTFRASGWTRHYETFAESLQIIAQLALGFALAGFRRRRAARWRHALAFAAFLLLGVGVAMTAMRAVLVAFAAGAFVAAWRAAAGGRARLLVVAFVALVVALGAVAVWRTRGDGALRLGDDSATLRVEVARVALRRTFERPIFGHGADAAYRHWAEWGFPGTVHVHTHSTPVQLAFDRGYPALLLWLWAVAALWLMAARAERLWRGTDDAGAHGLMLGATGALAGFFASSLVNYNFGDAEVALLVWWLAGAVVCFTEDERGAAGAAPPRPPSGKYSDPSPAA